MRMIRKPQLNLFFQWPEHKLSKELEIISKILHRHPEFVEWVHEDLSQGKEITGDTGMSSEQVLSAAIIKHVRKLSYEELAFNIFDSRSTQAFLMLEPGEYYASSCLQNNVSRISEDSWQKINASLVTDAKGQGIEDCKTARIDSTVTDSNIHYPTDSSLLYDCIRVIDREFKKTRKLANKKHWRLSSSTQVKQAKSIRYKINNAKNSEERLPLYKKLLKISRELKRDLPSIILKIEKECEKKEKLKKPLDELKNVDFFLAKIIYQTEKRVLKRQTVPASKKVVSIFEPHTDIIVKDRRETQFGHKIFLTSGKSNMVIDCEIPHGNPADSDMFMGMVNSLGENYGIFPRKISADGGFASKDNVLEAKELGVKDVCFPKRCRMKITDMVKSSWVYKKLLNWRAGIEGIISFLKRCFGMGRANWKGFDGFKKYVRSSVAAFNFVILARHEAQLE